MNRQLQMYLAELFGTFILVFLGAATVIGFGGQWAPFGFGIGLLAALIDAGARAGVVALVAFVVITATMTQALA